MNCVSIALKISGHLYCEDCYGRYLAPDCEKCKKKILGVSLSIIDDSTVLFAFSFDFSLITKE